MHFQNRSQTFIFKLCCRCRCVTPAEQHRYVALPSCKSDKSDKEKPCNSIRIFLNAADVDAETESDAYADAVAAVAVAVVVCYCYSCWGGH